MTTLADADRPPRSSSNSPLRAGGGARLAVIVMLIVSLLCTAGAQHWAQCVRDKAIWGERGRPESTSGSRLGGMNSFALALLLGGLRGPLVMILWTSSESQKNDKNLEDFDTKVEWIRLLQPEFDTVHLFQIWNKAYNISVQMASLSNKYITILDALEYARSVDEERPDDINIMAAIAGIYFDKFGTSSEKDYYRPRVRAETMPHVSRQKLRRDDPGWRRLELDPLLDAQGNILPQYLTPTHRRPANVSSNEPFYDGSELQYLRDLQPFPYGVSAFALAYNYHQRAQVLQNVNGQKHIQQSSLVIDSRPALALKNWDEEEWEIGRRKELQALGMSFKGERPTLELSAASVPLDTPIVNQAAYQEAIFSYGRTAQLCDRAVEEYLRHLKNFATNYGTYVSHMDQVKVTKAMAMADKDYLLAMTKQGDDRRGLTQSARTLYSKAAVMNQQIMLKYFVDEELVKKAAGPVLAKQLGNMLGGLKQNIEAIPENQLPQILDEVRRIIKDERHGFDSNQEDRGEYERYEARCRLRLQQLNK
ncbi:MAG TPA: hypothetical protein VIL86_12395 [Tepidisphaeraceae bacterium]|jgi:hypothetical protein